MVGVVFGLVEERLRPAAIRLAPLFLRDPRRGDPADEFRQRQRALEVVALEKPIVRFLQKRDRGGRADPTVEKVFGNADG
jgi:hypothetical protein